MKHFLRLAALLALFTFPSGADAAGKFWVGGSGNWSDTTHWATSSGGAGSTGVPATADTVTIDNHALGLNGGTLTVDVTPNTLVNLTMSTMVGTFDNSASKTFVLTGALAITGTTARTILGGTSSYTVAGSNSNCFDGTTTTSLTNPTTAFASATIIIGNGSNGTSSTFAGGGMTFGTVTVNSRTVNQPVGFTGTNTIGTLNIAGPNRVNIATSTITNIGTVAGSSSALIYIGSASSSTTANTLTLTNPGSASWVAFANTIISGAISGSALFDLGGNGGITFSAPPAGGGGGRIIGG